ncbi:KLTH0E04400p [Lachancea thermotolerans CBS 6340]|uniref:KLTH0E04400p n=1 Tax=Lachancea thermotolerans (strain ATCC 56472 / CBS 6340 / NRRL Y-8284) TaxID=559295 RepID=C5DHH6_LACTC|nr:KLTH0E04400p [Lachancea thermotolerans CBS 6340]CAR23237.1 KLTH0E04400p [Lachancea thermotolerans CBS 6340]
MSLPGQQEAPGLTESSKVLANISTSQGKKREEVVEDYSVPDEFEYAEGGWKAWMAILGSFLGFFPTWGFFYTAGVMQNYIAKNQLATASTSTISWVFSVYNFCLLGSFVFSGLYFDLNGARRPLILGNVMFLTGMFALGNCTKVWHFIVCLGILVGMGSGISSSPLIGVVCHHFNRRRGIATALAMNGGSIGGVVIPLMLRSLFEKSGYPWAMRSLGFLSTGFLVCSVFLAREDPAKLHKPQPGTLLRNTSGPSFVSSFLSYLSGSFDYKALKEPKYLFCTLGCCMAELSTGATLTYITSYCEVVGYRDEDAFYIITVLNALSIVGGYICSLLADVLFGRFNVMILINLLLGIIGFVMWLPFGSKGSGIMYAYGAIYGALYGSMLNLAPVCCGEISRVDEFGRRYSTMYALVGFTFLAGIPISGAIIGEGTLESYDNVIIFFSAVSIAAGVFYLLSKCFALQNPLKKSDSKESDFPGTLALLVKSSLRRF